MYDLEFAPVNIFISSPQDDDYECSDCSLTIQNNKFIDNHNEISSGGAL